MSLQLPKAAGLILHHFLHCCAAHLTKVWPKGQGMGKECFFGQGRPQSSASVFLKIFSVTILYYYNYKHFCKCQKLLLTITFVYIQVYAKSQSLPFALACCQYMKIARIKTEAAVFVKIVSIKTFVHDCMYKIIVSDYSLNETVAY